ncbi:MAG: hypothetical protein LLG37_02680 [Spirochaetia bacterium]|nr:hypothetical protein [Spirochaetia bacterium]
MPVSVCKYEANGVCVLLKKACEPVQKGCVINAAGVRQVERNPQDKRQDTKVKQGDVPVRFRKNR